MLSRKGNLLGSLVAQSMVVTIIFATMIVLLSTFDGPGMAPRLAATDLVVRVSPTETLDVGADSVPVAMQFHLPPELAKELESIDGISSVIPDTTYYSQLVQADGSPIRATEEAVPRGQSWVSAALTPFLLQEGSAPAREDEIVIDRALAEAGQLSVGDQTIVVNNTGLEEVRVSGIAALEHGDGLDRQSSIFYSPAYAEGLSQTDDGPELIGMMLREGYSRENIRTEIEQIIGDRPIEVLADRERGRADVTAGPVQVRELGEILGIMSGFVGFVAIFVLSGTFAFSIQQRHREIGLQRAVGFTPRQVRRLVVIEATIVAVLGSAIGVVAGWLLADLFVWGAIQQDRAPEGFTVSFQWLAMWIVLAAAFGIALLAAWSASRRATRIRPIEALRESSAPTRWIGFKRLILGLIFVGGGGAAIYASMLVPAVLAVLMSLMTTTLLTIGLSLLAPMLATPFVSLLTPLMQSRTNPTSELATTNARSFPARLGSVASPVLLSIGFATLMLCFVATSRVATVQISGDRMIADLYLIPAGEGMPYEIAPAVAALDGVEAIDTQFASIALFASEDSVTEMSVAGVDTSAVHATMDLNLESGSLDDFGPGSVLLSDFVALDMPVGAGDTATFLMEDMMPVELRIAGVFTNSLGTAEMLVAQDDLVPQLRDPLVSLVLLNVREGTELDAVAQQVKTLANEGYPLHVLTHEQYVSGLDDSIESDSWATFLIIGAAALFGALSVVNTLTMSTLERAREFALMRLIGSTPRQVMHMLAKESAIVTMFGVLLGWSIGILSTLSVSFGFVGDTSAMSVPIFSVIGVGLLAAAIVFGATLAAGAVALRRNPIQEIGSRW